MELIVKDIKERLGNCSPDELEKHISVWRNQFRQQGISIIALETLLNFYSEPHPIINSHSEDEFISLYSAAHASDFDDDYKLIRSEIENVRRENNNLQRQNRSLRKYSIALSVVGVLLIVMMLLMLFLIL